MSNFRWHQFGFVPPSCAVGYSIQGKGMTFLLVILFLMALGCYCAFWIWFWKRWFAAAAVPEQHQQGSLW